ncbi:MAG TPA: DNA gyrase subunit A [Caldilineae bacterium]|nr:DNA gyrase subunit A [Caldilineae bacterium]
MSAPIGKVKQIDIDQEMQQAYLDYAMSVIVARALPDVRDGLKPVQRRILYAMHDMGLTHDKPYKKSARIVGEVLGKYHPHGDAAVYDAMVRMAQDFSMRYPLVDGQGNFGSIDGDSAAAMRYTEARLAEMAREMLADIDKDTVDFVPNFDGSLQEPSVLPALLPNLLINGSSGIAVGMATNIPPHNLGEVCDAVAYLIDRYDEVDEVTVDELMRFIQGPDFPTGGIVYRYGRDPSALNGNGTKGEETDVIAAAYAQGRGRFVVQAKAHIEEMSRSRHRIVITELPYQTNKTRLIERIAELVREGRLEGITDLRDESDRQGMRIVIELTRTVDPREVLAQLFRLTPMQQTFSVSLLALVDGEPRLLSLKRMLQLYIEHRREIIRRRSEHDLQRARERAHILEGLLIALDHLDEVIATIRRSPDAETARGRLMRKFKLTEMQAQAILDMQLRRLARLERNRIKEEYKEKLKLIAYLEDLLAHPAKILALIREEVVELKKKYGDPRRTQIVARSKGALTARDLIEDRPVWVTISSDGTVTRLAAEKATKTALRKATGGVDVALLATNTRDELLLFTADGRMARVGIHRIPEGSEVHWADLCDLGRRDRVTAALAMPRFDKPPSDAYLALATRAGQIKRVALSEVLAAVGTPPVMNVDAEDELSWAHVVHEADEVIVVTGKGRAIRFKVAEVRPTGLLAGGVGAIKLQDGDQVAAFGVVAGKGALLTITAAGYAKRSPMEEFPTQGRYGQGVIAHKITDKTGPVVGAAVIARGAGPLAAVTEKGVSKPLAPRDVPEMGRNTQGKKVLSLAQGDTVRALLPLVGAGELAEEESEPSPAPRRRARAASKATTESRRTSTKAKAKASTKSAAKATSKRAQKATSKSKAKAEKKSASAKPAESKSAKAKTKKTKRDQSAAATKEKKTAQKSSRRKAEKAVDAKAQDTTSTAKEKETKRTKRRKVALVTSVPQIRQKK